MRSQAQLARSVATAPPAGSPPQVGEWPD